MMKHCNICVVSTRVSHSQLESQALTDAGDASKFDCLEFRDASGGGQGQSNKCYWYLEQPDKATALPFLRIRSVSSGYYLHVRRSWQTLAGNFGSRGKCLMLHRRAGPAGGGDSDGNLWFFDAAGGSQGVGGGGFNFGAAAAGAPALGGFTFGGAAAAAAPAPVPTLAVAPAQAPNSPFPRSLNLGSNATTGVIVTITNKATGKVLNADITGTGSGNGTNVQMWSNPNSTDSQWRIAAPVLGRPRTINGVVYTSFTVTNLTSGRCLNVSGGKNAKGTNVQLWDNPTSSHSQWYIQEVALGTYILRNASSGRVLNVAGNKSADGTNVIQWDNPSSTHSQWLLK